MKNKGRNVCVKAEQRLRNAAIKDAYQRQPDLQRDVNHNTGDTQRNSSNVSKKNYETM